MILISLGVGLAAATCLIFVRYREPIWQGKRLSAWIRELKVSLKVVEYPQGRTVFLANLADEEVFLLRPGRPKVRIIPRNWAQISAFYTNGVDTFGVCHREESEGAPAYAALQHLGGRAVPGLVAGLQRRDSKVVDFFNVRVWPRLPARLQAAIGTPMHPAHVRVNSAFGLGVLGAAAKPAVPELQKLLADTNPYVRAAALEALQRIDPATVGRFHPEIFSTPEEVARQPYGPADGNGETNSAWQTNIEFLPKGTVAPDFFERELEGRTNRLEQARDIQQLESLWRSDPGLLPTQPH